MDYSLQTMKQTKPCPHCGKTAGWWSPVKRMSMVFHAPDGEEVEQRIYECNRKNCTECNADITNCVIP